MATSPISLVQLTNASLDADDLEVVVNGDEDATTVNRAGNTLPSLAKWFAEATEQLNALLASGNFYETVAQGLADTTNGEYFLVESSNPNILFERYQNINGAAVNTGKGIPSIGAIEELQSYLKTVETDVEADVLFAFTDALQNVFMLLRGNGNLTIAGDLDSPKFGSLASMLDSTRESTRGGLWYLADALKNVHMYMAADSSLYLAGVQGSVQENLSNANFLNVQSLLNGTAAPGDPLPVGFTPLTPTLSKQTRFVWSGMYPDLRGGAFATRMVAYPFDWTMDPEMVRPTDTRREVSTDGGATWTATPLNVTGYPDTNQFRDLSVMYDRRTGLWWLAINAIRSQPEFYASDSFGLASSPDGINFTFHRFVPVKVTGINVWSPDWFVDDDGSVHIIVSGSSNGTTDYDYLTLRCTNTDTMLEWSEAKIIQGTAFPRNPATGHINMIDPCQFRIRETGVYIIGTKSENLFVNDGSDIAYGVLGWAASTTLEGPYNVGGAFRTADNVPIRGEGPSIIQLPEGSEYRFRLAFDNFLNLYGIPKDAVCYSNDLQTFTTPVWAGLAAPYNRHHTPILGA